MLWLLLKNKLRMLYNGYTRESSAKGRRKFMALIGGGVIFYLVYNWAYGLFRAITLSQQGNPAFILNLLIIFLFGFFVFLFFSGITVSIHYLFVSTDLPLLLSSPVSNKVIFSYKLIEAVFANSSFFLFIGIPILIAFGKALQQLNPVYFPGMILTVAAFITLPVSISFIISLFVVRILPAARAKELMAVLLGLISLGIWFAIQLFRAEEFNRFSSDYNVDKISQISEFTGNAVIEYLPSTLAAKSIHAFAVSNVRLIVSDFVPLVMVTILIAAAALVLAQKAFDAGIISPYSESGKRRKKGGRIAKSGFQRRLYQPAVVSIFMRDFKLLIRDFRHLTSLMILVAMMIVFPLIRGGDDNYKAGEELLLFIPIVFFSGIISSQLSSRSIPIEGKSFWITMMLPQKWSRIIQGKFALAFVFNLAAIWTAVFVSSLYFDTGVRVTVIALIITFLITASCCMYGLTIGSLFPNFDWEHPKRMLTSSGSLLLTIGVIAGVGIWIGLLALIYTVASESTFTADLATISISLLITGIIFLIGTLLISRKMEYLEWNFS